MASIKETMQIIENTPCDQPIMLKAIHGVGKSESIRDYFTGKGYRVVTLFLGQMSDAGDVLGLPMRREVTGANGHKTTVTDFCPPQWWPMDENEKVILFLDELNRAKPELHQVVMDLVLNRKLAGRKLPDSCHIVSAINPIENEGMYQVEEMDAALMDRFNHVDFRPTVDEWIDWAVKNKIDNKIIGFISKNNDHLDPPSGKDFKPGHVYPSRRSWARVGSILKKTPALIDQNVSFSTLLLGVVGERSTSAFMKFLRENSQIHVGTLLTDYKKVKEKVKACQIQDLVTINREICLWMNENEKLITDKDSGAVPTKIATNLELYLNDIPGEAMALFVSNMAKARVDNCKWPSTIMSLNSAIGKRLVDILSGSKISKT